MSVMFQNPVMAGADLARPQMQSPGFSITGKKGWAIFRDGTAYFFSVTAEGTITATQFDGTNFDISSAGAFWYSGTPGAGNLIVAIADAAGTDPYGNAYDEGLTVAAGTIIADYVQTAAGYPRVVVDGPDNRLSFEASATGIPAVIETGVVQGGLAMFADHWNIYPANDTAATIVVQGTLNSYVAGATETWHSLSGLASGWTVGTARYKLRPDNTVLVQILNLQPPASPPADGTAIWPAGSLPSGYQPANYVPISVCYHSGSAGTETPSLQVRPNGAIEVYGVGSTSVSRLDVTIIYPLD